MASLGLGPQAEPALDDYLARLDAALPGAWVYLTGSAVLDDWRPGRSDLDILTVTPRPLDEPGLDHATGRDGAGRRSGLAARR